MSEVQPLVQFEVPLIPTAKGRPRFARMGKFVRTFTDKKTEQAERDFIALAVEHAPPAAADGPVEVELEFVFPPLKSWPMWKLAAPGLHRHASKPDLSNLVKLIEDALNRTGRFWRDDAQVARIIASKRYGEQPKTVVRIARLTEPQREKAAHA